MDPWKGARGQHTSRNGSRGGVQRSGVPAGMDPGEKSIWSGREACREGMDSWKGSRGQAYRVGMDPWKGSRGYIGIQNRDVSRGGGPFGQGHRHTEMGWILGRGSGVRQTE